MSFPRAARRYLRPVVISFALLIAFIRGADAAQSTDQTYNLVATVTTRTTTLISKPMFSFHISQGRVATRLDGYVETSASSVRFSEALISLHISTSPACPIHGEDLKDYPQINAHFPSITLMAEIVKQAAIGRQHIPVHLRWSPPVPLEECLYLVLDGSDFAGKPYMMSAHLQLTTTENPATTKPDIIGTLADEFLMSPQRHETAYKVYHVPHDMDLNELYGNIAAVAGKGAVNRTPSRAWAVTHSVYLEHGGCPQFPHDGMYTDNPALDFFISAPQTDILASATLKGLRRSYPNAPFIFQPARPIRLHARDCVIHGVLASEAPGPLSVPDDGINTESQIGMEVTMH